MRSNPRGQTAPSTRATGPVQPGAEVHPKGSAIPFWRRFSLLLNRPVSGASLAVFRMAVGLVMMLEAWSMVRPSASTAGRIPLEVYYTDPAIRFNLPYEGFGWLPLLPPTAIHVVVALLGLGGVFLALGCFYRVAAVTVFLTWGYLYAVESTRTYWMSYYYLELLITFLLIWVPAARLWSVDAWRARVKPPVENVPVWTLWLLRGQLVVTYFYAGVAKLNADWLLDAQPVRHFLDQAPVAKTLAPFLDASQLAWITELFHHRGYAYFISYVGAAFDLAVGFLLLGRRTRFLGFALICVFHGVNHFLLFEDIVWFPLLGVLTATIFLDPDWPLRCRRWWRRPRFRAPDWRWLVAGGLAVPVFGMALGWKPGPPAESSQPSQPSGAGRLVAGFFVLWLLGQILIPVRHWFIAGDSRITFEGLPFSWRLKAEVYGCTPCQLSLDDPALVTRDPDGTSRIHWKKWSGDPVLYRSVTPAPLDWSRLPELVVLFEPMIGERVLYNPYAGVTNPRSEEVSRARASYFWQETYGHAPRSLERLKPLTNILYTYGMKLRRSGIEVRSRRELMDQLRADPQMIPVMRRMPPFALDGGRDPGGPFLLLDDPGIFREVENGEMRVDRRAWKVGESTRSALPPAVKHTDVSPLEVITAQDVALAGPRLPQAMVVESLETDGQGPRVVWNYLNGLPLSKAMHISLQPFLLRRYAHRIADQWEQEHGRRPAVHSQTHVSLNGRPLQNGVDPAADLGRVSVRWFGHNPWIRDLELARIPPGDSQ